MKIILIMGLPGSGKTTLASELVPLLKAKWLNADEVRKEANDWDFSAEGRTRQAKRMWAKAKEFRDQGNHVVADLFKEIIKKTGQVCIQIRDVQGVDDNPFDFETVKKNIEDKLNPEFEGRFKIMLVPNITNICYGRGVGYKIEEIVLPEEIQKISATKIRAKMREDGKLK